MDALSDFDRQRIKQLDALVRDNLAILYEIERKQAVETRPLERQQLRQQSEQVRENYNRYREEYADLLRKEIPAQFAPSEQALIHTVMQHLNPDQLDLTRTALQEAERDPYAPELTQLAEAVIAALPAVQQQLVGKNMTVAHHVAHAAHLIQAPTVDLKQKLKLSIPLIPLFLSYETEFNLNLATNLKVAWERLKERFHPS